MIAYNKTELDALLIREQAEQWHEDGLLSTEKWDQIKAQYPPFFYSPNEFVRLGLAAFIFILLVAITSLIGITVVQSSLTGWGIVLLLVAGGCFALLETKIIPVSKHFSSGVDDMLVYFGTGSTIAGIWAFLEPVDEPRLLISIALVFLVLASIRYVDRLTAVGAVYAGFLLIYFTGDNLPQSGLVLVPFAGMVYFAMVYCFAINARKRVDLRHWDGVLGTVELVAPVAFYLSGNYWVVKEVFLVAFYDKKIPMEGFFWLFTFLVPAIYLYIGLRHKNRILLDLGIAAIAVTIATYRAYFAVMPLAWAAVLSGAILLVIAYFSIRYLKTNHARYIYAADGRKNILQTLEEQAIQQGLGSHSPTVTQQDGMGGGAFGGGGAGDRF